MTILERIIFYGVIFLPSLVSTLAFAVWLPMQSNKWKNELIYAALISSTMLVFSLIISIFLINEDILSDLLLIPFVIFLLVLFSPHVVCANALLYYGGKAIRIHLNRGRVVFGYVRVVLGFLLMPVPLALITGFMGIMSAFGN